MTPYVEWLHAFIINYPAFQYIIVLLGAAFGGEVVMIALSFLAAQGLFSLLPFCLTSFVGLLSSDVLWFWLGKTEKGSKFFSYRFLRSTVAVITEAVERVSQGNNFVALLLANFMLASRIVIIMYVSRLRVSFLRFLSYEVIAGTLWLISVISIGFISGLGFSQLAELFQNLYVAIGFILLVIFGIVIFQIWLERRFTKKR